MPDRPTGSPSTSAGPAGRDWPDEIADRIESVVGSVRAKTTVPVTRAARAVVFGLVAGALAAAASIVFVIALVRVLDVYLPWHPQARRVWTVYAGASAIFLAAGAFAWRKRRPRERS